MRFELHTIRAAVAVAALGLASAAQAAITVDGTLDTDYGAPILTVTYDANANTSNFGQDLAHLPGKTSNAIGYKLYSTTDATNIYGFLQTFGPGVSAGSFANIYFDLSPINGDDADVMCEITNYQCKILGPGEPFQAVPIVVFSDADTIEFSIAKVYFNNVTGPIRLSQSFGYSVATTAAIPEPATWGLMLMGFGGLGAMIRRRRAVAA